MNTVFSKSYVIFVAGAALVITGARALPASDFALVLLGALIIYIGGLNNE